MSGDTRTNIVKLTGLTEGAREGRMHELIDGLARFPLAQRDAGA